MLGDLEQQVLNDIKRWGAQSSHLVISNEQLGSCIDLYWSEKLPDNTHTPRIQR